MPHRVAPGRAPGLAQIRVHERIARLRMDKLSPTAGHTGKTMWYSLSTTSSRFRFISKELEKIILLLHRLKKVSAGLIEQYSRATDF
ncbi:hypothetical protein F442_20134 [Phytophthora nicotianae P10297]|uniref:Uncharacterized protein n=1 Tax=Phytophthora nicotianae P10297 TaxID=1317064 RepID=W2Y775_PHYNI|nr:hypothetical protein F442_20134 [Phytophthora nicotianae P10297]